MDWPDKYMEHCRAEVLHRYFRPEEGVLTLQLKLVSQFTSSWRAGRLRLNFRGRA